MSHETYRTPFSSLSDGAVAALFSTQSWARLSAENRLAACQELENRFAAQNNAPPCKVVLAEMTGGTYGYQQGNTITLNAHLVKDGCFVVNDKDDQGRVIQTQVPCPAPGWNLMDTVFHEGTHGLQEYGGRAAMTYVPPGADRDLYRIQPNEKEAFANGQQMTRRTIMQVEQSANRIDPQSADYLAMARGDSFQEALRNAMRHYNDPQIERTLAQVIHDRDNGIQPQAPSPSYRAISDLLDSYGNHLSRAQIAAATAQVQQDPGMQAPPNAAAQAPQAAPAAENDGAARTAAAVTMTAGTVPAVENDGAGLESGSALGESAVPAVENDGAGLESGSALGESSAPAVENDGAGLESGSALGESAAPAVENDGARLEDAGSSGGGASMGSDSGPDDDGGSGHDNDGMDMD